jgi:hypothetical protein
VHDNSWRWIALLILGIGTLIVAGGVALGWGSLKLVLHGQKTEAEVVELRDVDGKRAPVFAFRLPSGEVREAVGEAVDAPKFTQGDRVGFYYDPQDHSSFRADTFDEMWFGAVFVVCFGCFWLLFGLIAWALSRDVEMFIVGERAFGVIALAAAGLGVLATWDTASLYASGLRAEGTVIEVRISRTIETEERESGDRTTRRQVERVSFAPLVRFVAADGRQVEFLGKGGSEEAHKAGDRVTVLYRPEAPAAATLLEFLDLWLPAVVCWAVFVIFGGVVWLSRRTRLRPA